ncbi:MAG: heme biosynthesis HemY N-terminal domain-containing protein, partial [Bdellovibrionales bacterium]
MIKALWFLIKIGVVIAAIIWVADHPGSVRIEWLDYVFTVNTGLFFAALLAVVLASIFIYRVIRTFVDFPASYRYYSEIRARKKGYDALTRGLAAVAAGDAKTAQKEAAAVRGLLPDDNGLPVLLAAQAARLNGDDEAAEESFHVLLEHKDASFLGVRGLLQAALEDGDYEGGLAMARQALARHPKQPWILKTVYDLEIRNCHWGAAQ